MNRLTLAATIVLAFTMSPSVFAADESQEHDGAHEQSAQTGAVHKLHGMVNSVNAEAGRINITHDPVASLKWPKMRMNFKAHDSALLAGIKPGMSVDFEIQKMGNEYYLIQIAPVK